MNWLSVKYATESAAILVLAGCALYAAHDFHETNVAVRSGVVQTLGNINRPCGKQPCGTLATINKAVVKIGDAVVTTQLQERQIGQHTAKDMDTVTADIQSSLKPLPAAIQSFSAAATALTGTAHSASGMLQTAQTTIQSFQPVAGHIDGTVDSFNALLQSKDVTGILHNGNVTLTNIAATTGDFQYYLHPILHPIPCKTARCRVARFVKGDLPFWVGVGADASRISQALSPVRVTIVH